MAFHSSFDKSDISDTITTTIADWETTVRCCPGVLALAAGALLVPAACFASAIDFANALITRDSQLSLGFVFTSNGTVNITSLGYYDENQDGFLTDH